MPKKKESLETQVAVQEADIEYIKEALTRVERSLEQLQDKFLTKAEYYERGKIIEHIEKECRELVNDTKVEVARIDTELDDIDHSVEQMKWWLKAIAWGFGIVWPIIMLVLGVWMNRYL